MLSTMSPFVTIGTSDRIRPCRGPDEQVLPASNFPSSADWRVSKGIVTRRALIQGVRCGFHRQLQFLGSQCTGSHKKTNWAFFYRTKYFWN